MDKIASFCSCILQGTVNIGIEKRELGQGKFLSFFSISSDKKSQNIGSFGPFIDISHVKFSKCGLFCCFVGEVEKVHDEQDVVVSSYIFVVRFRPFLTLCSTIPVSSYISNLHLSLHKSRIRVVVAERLFRKSILTTVYEKEMKKIHHICSDSLSSPPQAVSLVTHPSYSLSEGTIEVSAFTLQNIEKITAIASSLSSLCIGIRRKDPVSPSCMKGIVKKAFKHVEDDDEALTSDIDGDEEDAPPPLRSDLLIVPLNESDKEKETDSEMDFKVIPSVLLSSITDIFVVSDGSAVVLTSRFSYDVCCIRLDSMSSHTIECVKKRDEDGEDEEEQEEEEQEEGEEEEGEEEEEDVPLSFSPETTILMRLSNTCVIQSIQCIMILSFDPSLKHFAHDIIPFASTSPSSLSSCCSMGASASRLILFFISATNQDISVVELSREDKEWGVERKKVVKTEFTSKTNIRSIRGVKIGGMFHVLVLVNNGKSVVHIVDT
ncbi:hypothetical protein ADUPG1_012849 [Aduncisulcus paluster]|uniref:Uncharacterized protein n=1 Tax=Aduncisulcus paluster TaxID=2918883 RepID=A0ABQ5K0W6_9EUKA|nr:hypothetical protein ADUPG1_012849 [Aduncisulcus paluster]